jgi:hypothetical protein
MATQRSTVTVGALCLAVAVSALAPQRVLAGDEGAASPQAVAKALQEAGKNDDFRKIVPLIHPDDRPMMAMVMLLAGGMAAAFSEDAESTQKEFQAILAKHGLGQLSELPEPEGKEAAQTAATKLFKNVDLLALIPDLFDFMNKHMKQPKKEVIEPGEIKDLQVEGDSATALAGDEKVRFGRVGDRWYVRMEE